MAGMSLLQSILLNDEESEKWYQELLEFSKQQTGSMRKIAQARLLYLDISLPQRGNIHTAELLGKLALLIKERYHFVRVFVREGVAVLKLLQDKRLKWGDKAYMSQILQECELQANYYPNYLMERISDVKLSDTAIAILRMQADGTKNSAIAEKLEMSLANVKYYNTETYKKLGVKSKVAAVTEARKRKLI